MLLSVVRHYTKTGPKARAASRSGCPPPVPLRQLAASKGCPRAEPRTKEEVAFCGQLRSLVSSTAQKFEVACASPKAPEGGHEWCQTPRPTAPTREVAVP